MSFFGKENFNLPDGVFQEGINISLSGNGTVYQDGTYCYVNTYADADAAILYSGPLSAQNFYNYPLSITVQLQLTNLPDGDRLYPLFISYGECPIIGSSPMTMAYPRLWRSGATYYLQWIYNDSGGTGHYWNQSTSSWTVTSTDYVRTISLNTWYTLTTRWNPVTKLFTLTDGTYTATTGATRLPTSFDDVYWFCGDYETSSYYGQLKLEYIYSINTDYRSRFTIRNSLTKAYKKSPFFTALNNLTTRYRDSFTLKNSILDHTPYRSDFTALNNIGVEGQLIYLDGAWVTRNIKGKQLSNRATVEIDSIDVSAKVTDWSIDYDDQTLCKTISVTVKDRAYAQSIVARKYSDSGFDDPRIEVIDHQGYSLGQFLIENKSESAAHKSYSCTLSGRSMTALLDIPFSENLQTLYDTATSKSAVVNALAAAKDLTVLWGIPDAPLPIGALTCDDESPISVIKKIVEAGGGLVYTDRSDNLLCAYKDYETTGKSPVMSLSSGDIVSISQSRTVPNGENQITVEGYTDTSITDGWAQISIEASKYKLKSNGFDSCTVTATCRNEDLSIPDVELIEDEQQTPASNDHYEISVSKMIDAEGGGVVSIVKESDSSLVAGPYEILDARTIRVGTAMADTTYLVTYYGGDTVTFSVDNYADISPTEVLVKNGRAQATLRASAGGGGYAVVSADYLDAQTAQITVTIADPRVGSVDVSCDPSSIAIGETSTVKIQVLDSDGFPADNGLYVDISVIGYGQDINYAGVVAPTTATTTTESITDGGLTDGKYNPIYPVSEIEVSTQYPISSLTSIYRYENGQPYTDVNYASGAVVDGNTITLATPLPSSVTPIQVTYECSGIATATFSYPSYRSVPTTSITNLIVASCGGEVGSGYITIESPYSGGSSGSGGGGGHTGFGYVDIKAAGQPNANSSGQVQGMASVRDSYFSGEYHKANFITEKADWKKTSGLGSFSWAVERDAALHVTYLILIAQALQELPGGEGDTKTKDPTGKTYVSGSRVVKNSVTDAVIAHAYYSLAWGDDTETGYTNDNGSFSFSKGQPGLTGVVTLTKSGYLDRTASITIPGDLGDSNIDTGSDMSVRKWATLDVFVTVPYRRQTL
jgi:hypothetical protein